MKSRTLIVGLVLLLLLVLSAPVCAQQPAGAEATFKAKCAMCHGADAAGKTPMGSKLNIPDLRSAQKQPAAGLEQTITKGKNKMPAFEGKLTAQQISELAVYIQKLK